MEKWKFDYTIESTASGTVVIEANDMYDALDQFEMMKEDLIAENMEELKKVRNIRVLEPYWEKVG